MLSSFVTPSFWRMVVGGLFLPVMVPWILYRLVFSWNYATKQREKLENRVVLITGASSGLGEALAQEFYKAGCKLILSSRRVDELERVKRNLLSLRSDDASSTYPPKILQLDLADLKALPAKGNEALSIYGRIDILINNGGISCRGSALETSLETDLKLMVVNYFGQIALTKALLPSMIEQGYGHIVVVGSVQGRFAIPFRTAYSASKHALQAFFDSLRAEHHHQNIKVTVVSPGYIKTNLSVNAVTGSGDNYGKMDTTTSEGWEPSKVAHHILKAVVLETPELFACGIAPKAALMLRVLFAKLYFVVMRRRAAQQMIKD